jgi:hypothetical protein
MMPAITLTVAVTGLSSSDISDFNTAIFAVAVRSTFSNTNKTDVYDRNVCGTNRNVKRSSYCDVAGR